MTLRAVSTPIIALALAACGDRGRDGTPTVYIEATPGPVVVAPAPKPTEEPVRTAVVVSLYRELGWHCSSRFRDVPADHPCSKENLARDLELLLDTERTELASKHEIRTELRPSKSHLISSLANQLLFLGLGSVKVSAGSSQDISVSRVVARPEFIALRPHVYITPPLPPCLAGVGAKHSFVVESDAASAGATLIIADDEHLRTRDAAVLQASLIRLAAVVDRKGRAGFSQFGVEVSDYAVVASPAYDRHIMNCAGEGSAQ